MLRQGQRNGVAPSPSIARRRKCARLRIICAESAAFRTPAGAGWMRMTTLWWFGSEAYTFYKTSSRAPAVETQTHICKSGYTKYIYIQASPAPQLIWRCGAHEIRLLRLCIARSRSRKIQKNTHTKHCRKKKTCFFSKF